MRVVLIGTGCGPGTLTIEADRAVRKADLLIGAKRLLEAFPDTKAEKEQEYRAQAILEVLKRRCPENACVLLSGDSGFYSGAASLYPLLRENGIDAEILPGISSLQYFAAVIGEPWQGWNIVSAHGAECDPIFVLMQGKPVFILTGGADTPAAYCRTLEGAGLGGLPVIIGENLGSERERIVRTTAREGIFLTYADLNVMLIGQAPVCKKRTPGIPDEEFIRDRVPMTKQEVRASILSKLAVSGDEVCWDIGAGTGSVSVELALASRSVWAVEQKSAAVTLIGRNREKFCAWNLHPVLGEAPEALEGLPAPDAVFVGGSGGRLDGILSAVNRANPKARICVSAVTLETLHRASEQLETMGYRTEAVQISVSRTRKAGRFHMLEAQNPVFLITGTPESTDPERQETEEL